MEAALSIWPLNPQGMEVAVSVRLIVHKTLYSPSFPQNWKHHEAITPVLSNADIIDSLQHCSWLLLGDGKIIVHRLCQFLRWKHLAWQQQDQRLSLPILHWFPVLCLHVQLTVI